jgi:prepilin-type N-terminal cleavage/methylation domain-containing protein
MSYLSDIFLEILNMDVPHKKLGFTIIELVIVILISTILATAVYLRWPGVSVKLDAQTKQLVADLRYTQNLAMSRGERYRLVITGHSYQIISNTGEVVVLPSGSNTSTFATTNITTSLPNSLVVFDTRGVPYIDTASPGTLLGPTPATISLSAGAYTKTITITPETGRVL